MANFFYSRVSTSNQSTDNQRLEVANSGFKIDFYFEDVISGSSSIAQRPQFRLLLEKIRDGETLIVSKLDRLGRDAIDVLETIRKLAIRNIQVIVLNLGKADLTSAAGKLLLTMLSAVAEMERDLLIERTKSGLDRAKAEGKVLGRPAKTTDEDRLNIIEKLNAGATVTAVAKEFNISRASVIDIRSKKKVG